jgi:hypothetical protein
MQDDNKVFDVAKPGRTAPAPTSRPIIVGQSTTGVDTMMKESPQPELAPEAASPTAIHVSMADEEPVNIMGQPTHSEIPSVDPELSQGLEHEDQHEAVPEIEGATIPPHELDEEPQPEENSAAGNFTPLTSLIPNAEGKEDTASEPSAHHVDNLPESHTGGPIQPDTAPLPISPGAGPKRRWPKFFMWLVILALLIGIGGFLAIDAGLVKSDINLPFHIFNKQKTSKSAVKSSASTARPATPPPVQSSIPEGFSKYTIEGASVSFAYPTAWGAPSSKTEQGYSKRDQKSPKSDGTYAYIVNFATNKDVEVAVTSSKYLPSARGHSYYDYLQWCIGTNDGKYYQELLHFSTSNGIDTPSTVTCDQGPLEGVTKIDDQTIVQNKAKFGAASDQTVDIYIQNLSNKELPVLHVKDAAMKNSSDIKKILTNVKINSSSTSTTQ